MQARRPARGRPSACRTLRAMFAVLEASAAYRRSTRSRSAGVCADTSGVAALLITTDVPTRPLAVGAQPVTWRSALTPQAGQRCARMASAFTSQLRNYRAIARARRRRLLLRRRRGSRLGGRVSNGPCFRAKAAVVRGGTRLRLWWVERVDLARKPPRLRSFSSTCETWPERSRRARPEFSNPERRVRSNACLRP